MLAEHIRLFSDAPRSAFNEAQALSNLVRPDWANIKVSKVRFGILRFAASNLTSMPLVHVDGGGPTIEIHST